MKAAWVYSPSKVKQQPQQRRPSGHQPARGLGHHDASLATFLLFATWFAMLEIQKAVKSAEGLTSWVRINLTGSLNAVLWTSFVMMAYIYVDAAISDQAFVKATQPEHTLSGESGPNAETPAKGTDGYKDYPCGYKANPNNSTENTQPKLHQREQLYYCDACPHPTISYTYPTATISLVKNIPAGMQYPQQFQVPYQLPYQSQYQQYQSPYQPGPYQTWDQYQAQYFASGV
ncbi:hypothetical protein B0H65DRAFT_545656 [Neurospora tetraspora]|uniref:Uncharacterized protein n=1 Tax=Neurospora tetraspora TaxID=94610 RepID=A0AAE0MUB3_9PEZI|nr:hypothetical protein B0H65DRAFT_545656 [Neurospora tetraspora]